MPRNSKNDIEFEEQTIRVAPKEETAETWEWLIKDTDRRTLPLTDELTQLLVDQQGRQPEGYPYVSCHGRDMITFSGSSEQQALGLTRIRV
jgi:hypothetical protein